MISKNRGEIVKQCNDLGLVFYPMSEDFSMIFSDSNLSEKITFLQSRLLGISVNQYRSYCEKFFIKGSLCPVGVISMLGEDGPQSVLRSGNPGDAALPLEVKKLISAAKQVGMIFTSNIFVQVGYYAGEKIVRLVDKKLGGTLLETTVTSYSQLKAVLDSGMFQESPAGKVANIELVKSAIEDFKETSEFKNSSHARQMISKYEKEILSPDLNPNRITFIWSDILAHLAFNELQDTEIFLLRTTYHKNELLQNKHWIRLGKALTNSDWVRTIKNNMDK